MDIIEKKDIGAPLTPTGLTYAPNAIAPDVGDRLMAQLLASDAWVGVTASPNSRQVIHYGFRYDYTRSSAPAAVEPIPSEFAALVAGRGDFDQLIINKYEPGQGISAHIDHPVQFGATIICFTLGSGTDIVFTHPSGLVRTIYVAPNSMYIMTGESRYLWTHAILGRKSRGTRISLTFRKVLRGGK